MSDELPGGYAGRILRVDMNSGESWIQNITPEECREYIGAVGFGTKILWDEVPGNVRWSDPENRLILASGPLAGTPIWGTGSLTVITKGALTNGATVTNAQGFFGANLKFSGYDAIVLQGQSSKWVYLYIEDDTVELRDASHIVGLDTWEMQDTLQQEYGMPGHMMSVYGIGPAGENLVKWAVIEGDYGHVASKNGCGAVMGSKKLKCVAIARGSKGIRVHDTAGLFQAADMISHELMNDPATVNLYRYGTLGGVYGGSSMGTVPTKNYTTNLYPEPDRLEEMAPQNIRDLFPHRGHQCSSCGMKGHCHMVIVPRGERKGTIIDEPEYEGLSGCGPQLGCVDPVDVSWLNTQVDKAGVDVNEFGWVIGWVMECYEKGYFTKEQLGGVEATWGNAEAANQLLQMIANREGFGDILANGVRDAAKEVGGEAAECAIYIEKGASPRGHDHRARWSEMLDATLGSAGTIETGPLVKPEEFGISPQINPFDPDMVGYVTAVMLGRRHFEDSLGTCQFTTRTYLELVCRALNAVTGWNYTKEEALDFGKKCSALMRVFNLRGGVGLDVEKPSERYWSTPIDGPAAGQSAKENWETMANAYYQTLGYDRETGKPFPETLRRLGLDDIISDIWGEEEAKVTN